MASVGPLVRARVLGAVIRALRESPELDPSRISELSGVAREVVRELLEVWSGGTGRLDQTRVIELAAEALERSGGSVEVLRALGWSLFEDLIGALLERMGLETLRDVRVKVGRRWCQIDVVALRGGDVYALECKHWMRSVTSSLMASIASSHLRRVELLEEGLRSSLGEGDVTVRVVPVAVALYVPPSTGEVLFVPVRALASFLSEHPAALPSPPVRRLKLGRRPDASTFTRPPFRASREATRLDAGLTRLEDHAAQQGPMTSRR
ncbi:MAG: restriction endonuclease [Nitrososphaerota archaeon]|nr:restriction endonuclease [Candidatus Calditenuis fumarioli]